MKTNFFITLGTTSLLVATLAFAGNAREQKQFFSNSQPLPVITIAQNQGMMVMSGKFMTGEKTTTGMAKIIKEGNHYYLELDNSFSTSDQGPDLHVLLDTNAQPPKTYTNLYQTINLGKLQKFKGMQRYPIPDAINLSQIKSVVIWCRMANATFGYAPLSK
jgi:hypothetical protein